MSKKIKNNAMVNKTDNINTLASRVHSLMLHIDIFT